MWYKNISKDSDVVVSTRVRYARNISGYKFCNMLNELSFNEIIKLVENSIDKSKYKIIKMKDIDKITQNSLKEKNLISNEMLNNKYGAIVINQDSSLVCMINEEDHLRIQVFEAGFNIENCYDKLFEFTKNLENNISFVKSEKYGYLTSCPTNIGSAMRVSVMLHLPALEKVGMLSQVLEQVSKMGLSIRGIHGENSNSIGNMYQISNTKTLGISDREIIENLKIVVNSVINSERKARNILKNDILFLDEVYRAYGILKNSRVISCKEAMSLLSVLRLGISVDVIKEISLETIQTLMIGIQKNTLKLELKKNYEKEEEDILRADYIRKVMM